MSTPNQSHRVGPNQQLGRRALAVGIVLIVIVAAACVLLYSSNSTAKQQTGSMYPLSGAPTTANVAIPPCNYEVFLVGGMTTAQNCATGIILDQSTNSADVINDAIGNSTSGGIIFIKGGTYTLTTTSINMGGGNYAAIGTAGVSNIELFGEGNSTILSAGTNLNAAVVGVENVNGWYIHDLQINGNRVQQSGNGIRPQQMGIFLWDSNNDVIQRVYIHDEKTYGIQATGQNIKILDNVIVNSDANGIILYGGSDYLVEGNTVNGSSDVGISISGQSATSGITGVVCIDNIILNTNLAVSPYRVNSGDGIIIGDNGAANNVTASDNLILVAYYGFWVGGSTSPATNVIISDNQIYPTTNCGRNCYGIALDAVTSALVQGNIIAQAVDGIYIYAPSTNVEILGNSFRLISGTGPIVFATSSGGCRIEDNLGYNPVGYISSPISGTSIVDSGSSSTWTSGTTYTNWGSPKVLYLSGGTVTAIVVDGKTLYTSAASVTVILQPSDTFSMTFSVQPTVTVFGE